MRYILQLSLVILLLTNAPFAGSKEKDFMFRIGLKVPWGIQVNRTTTSSFAPLNGSRSASLGIGTSVDLILYRFLDLETGAYYRGISYRKGNLDLSINSVWFPILLN
ncbi:MAG: hypothetical protein IEMM0008_0455 [bacterium]|nr:MAG: hypothetical protein IEMM0008_0455 [bacterium]